MSYISLHNHTCYTMMQSTIRPENLFARAAELNMPAVAITDYCSLAAIWEAYKHSLKYKVKLIVGCQFNFVDDRQPVFDFIKDQKKGKATVNNRHLILLAKNMQGYKNLLLINRESENCKIDRLSKTDKVPLIDWKILDKYHEGLICTTGGVSGIVSGYINSNELDKAVEEAIAFKSMFGDDFVFELQPNNFKDYDSDQFLVNRTLKKLSQDLGIIPIAASNSRYIHKEGSQYLNALIALKYHRVMSDKSRPKLEPDQFYLHSEEEIIKFFSRNMGVEFAQQLCDNTKIIADKCENPEWIKPEIITGDKSQLPNFPVKDEPEYKEFKGWCIENKEYIENIKDEDKQYMRYWCNKNFPDLVQKNKYDEYADRLLEELDVLRLLVLVLIC